MSDVPLIDLQLPNRITTTDVGLQFISSKSTNSRLHTYTHTQHIPADVTVWWNSRTEYCVIIDTVSCTFTYHTWQFIIFTITACIFS